MLWQGQGLVFSQERRSRQVIWQERRSSLGARPESLSSQALWQEGRFSQASYKKGGPALWQEGRWGCGRKGGLAKCSG